VIPYNWGQPKDWAPREIVPVFQSTTGMKMGIAPHVEADRTTTLKRIALPRWSGSHHHVEADCTITTLKRIAPPRWSGGTLVHKIRSSILQDLSHLLLDRPTSEYLWQAQIFMIVKKTVYSYFSLVSNQFFADFICICFGHSSNFKGDRIHYK